MDDKLNGYGLIIFLVLLFVLFGNGWNSFGGRYAYAGDVSSAEVERRNIIEAAETNYRVIDQGNLTRQVVEATAGVTQQKIDFYAYQGLRDQLAEVQRQNLVLQNQIYNDRKFGVIEAQLANISCQMLKRPDVTGIGAVCPNSAIINGLGINSLGGCGLSCGCNGLA